jgi:anti-anti-sigma regulatory factor
VVLAIGGGLTADTAGWLRMFLSMFTVAGGPQELVLDLSDVLAVDEDGMAPVFETDVAMRLRCAPLRLVSGSASVAHFLDVGYGQALATGPAAEPGRGPGRRALDDGGPRPGRG